MIRFRRFLYVPASVLFFIIVALPASAFASHTSGPLYKLDVTSKVPNWDVTTCYDIVSVFNHTGYVSDNNTSAANSAVRKAKSGATTVTPIGLGLFAGPAGCHAFDFSQDGPTGNMVVQPRGEGQQWHGGGGGPELWVGDGNSTVKVFDLATGKLLTKPPIQTGAPSDKRADELDYIPTTNQVVFANPDASPAPFLTYIDATTFKVLSRQVFDGKNGNPNATAGMEQPRFYRGLLYLALPATTQNPGGEIDKINPRTHAILRVYPTPNCGASGLTMIGIYAATGCANGASQIVNLGTGRVTTLSAGKGSDMVAGDVSLGRFFFADYASSSLIITDVHGNILDTIATDDLAHSVAVDQQTHRVFVPEGSLGGVAQYVPTKG